MSGSIGTSEIVVDASITLAWLLGEPGTAEGVIRDALLKGMVAPALWPLEVANGIAMAARRKRIAPEQRQILLKLATELNIEIDPPRGLAGVFDIDALSSRHDLTIYDAAYLETAIRRGAALATLDTDLRAAAKREGVTILPA